jgi:TPR repeat protein
MYQEGRGVAQNDQEAARWYHKAAEQGHTEAAIKLNNMNSIWYDESTNLTWMRCSLGQTWDGTTCVGTAQKYTWEEAQQAVAEMNRNGGYAGYTDWVVPDLEAIKSIVRDHDKQPKIDHAIFPNTPASFYWSASPDAGNHYYAWYVNFYLGHANHYNKSLNYYVRAVRAGQ